MVYFFSIVFFKIALFSGISINIDEDKRKTEIKEQNSFLSELFLKLRKEKEIKKEKRKKNFKSSKTQRNREIFANQVR